MKKSFFSILAMLGLMVGVTACDDYTEPNPAPQINPQLPGFTAQDLEVSSANDGNIDLTQAIADNQMIYLAKVDKLENFPEDYKLSFTMQMSGSQDFSPEINIATLMQGDSILVDPKAWDEAHHQLITVGPNAKDVYIRLSASAVKDAQSVILGGPDQFYMTESLKVSATGPGWTVEEKYYLLDTATSQLFEMNNSGKDAYDDPVFTTIVDVPSAGMAWKVVPESAKSTLTNSAVLYGVSAEEVTATEGALVLGGASNTIAQEARYMVTVNMKESTFKVSFAYDCLYVLGAAQDGANHAAQLTTKDFVKYGSFIAFSGWGCKIKAQPNWDPGMEIGGEGAEAQMQAAGTGYAAQLGMGTSGIQNIVGLPDGLYAYVINLGNLVLEASPIEGLELIGDATGGWGDGDTKRMTGTDPGYTPVKTKWETIADFTEGSFKIRCIINGAGSWNYSLGGTADQLIWDGDNIPSPGIGKYKVTLDLNNTVLHLDFQKVD